MDNQIVIFIITFLAGFWLRSQFESLSMRDDVLLEKLYSKVSQLLGYGDAVDEYDELDDINYTTPSTMVLEGMKDAE